jgi:hypothetical protein
MRGGQHVLSRSEKRGDQVLSDVLLDVFPHLLKRCFRALLGFECANGPLGDPANSTAVGP